MTIGYAYVNQQNIPFANTVAATERAAMVNALVAIFGRMVHRFHSDEDIEAMFKSHAPEWNRISLVEITIVEPRTD